MGHWEASEKKTFSIMRNMPRKGQIPNQPGKRKKRIRNSGNQRQTIPKGNQPSPIYAIKKKRRIGRPLVGVFKPLEIIERETLHSTVKIIAKNTIRWEVHPPQLYRKHNQGRGGTRASAYQQGHLFEINVPMARKGEKK